MGFLEVIKKEKNDPRTTMERFSDYMVNDGVKLVFIVLWVLANIAVFGERFYREY
jgi:hypothetical protein